MVLNTRKEGNVKEIWLKSHRCVNHVVIMMLAFIARCRTPASLFDRPNTKQ
jgi:hypothetical protein